MKTRSWTTTRATGALAALAVFTAAPAVDPSTASADWTWPLRGRVVTSYVNDNDEPYAGGMHRGIDIAAPAGTRVVAAQSGSVTHAAPLGFSGLTVAIRTSDRRYVTSYLHLSKIAVARGAAVAAGETVGEVGTSGKRSTPEPHLHFGVRLAETDRFYIDPLTLLPPIGDAGTEPLPAPVAAPAQPRAEPVPLPLSRPVTVTAPEAPAGAIRPFPATLPVPAAPGPVVVPAPAARATPAKGPAVGPGPAGRAMPEAPPVRGWMPGPAALPVPAGRPAERPLGAPSPLAKPVETPRVLGSPPAPSGPRATAPVPGAPPAVDGRPRAEGSAAPGSQRLSRERTGRSARTPVASTRPERDPARGGEAPPAIEDGFDWGRPVAALGVLLIAFAVAGRRALRLLAAGIGLVARGAHALTPSAVRPPRSRPGLGRERADEGPAAWQTESPARGPVSQMG